MAMEIGENLGSSDVGSSNTTQRFESVALETGAAAIGLNQRPQCTSVTEEGPRLPSTKTMDNNASFSTTKDDIQSFRASAPLSNVQSLVSSSSTSLSSSLQHHGNSKGMMSTNEVTDVAKNAEENCKNDGTEPPVLPADTTRRVQQQLHEPEHHQKSEEESKTEDDRALSQAIVQSMSAMTQTSMTEFNQRVALALTQRREQLAAGDDAAGASSEKDANHSDSADEISRRIMDTTVGRQLRCVCSSVVPLGRYYATYGRRADWDENWQQEMQKGEKLQVSPFFSGDQNMFLDFF